MNLLGDETAKKLKFADCLDSWQECAHEARLDQADNCSDVTEDFGAEVLIVSSKLLV